MGNPREYPNPRHLHSSGSAWSVHSRVGQCAASRRTAFG